MAVDGSGWLWMVADGGGWLWMAVDGGGWLRMAVDGCGLPWIAMVTMPAWQSLGDILVLFAKYLNMWV